MYVHIFVVHCVFMHHTALVAKLAIDYILSLTQESPSLPCEEFRLWVLCTLAPDHWPAVYFCKLYSFCNQLYFVQCAQQYRKQENGLKTWFKRKRGLPGNCEGPNDTNLRFESPLGPSLGSTVQIYFMISWDSSICIRRTSLKLLKSIWLMSSPNVSVCVKGLGVKGLSVKN